MLLNTIFPHLLVFVGSLLLLMLPDTAPQVSPLFREIPDADFEQLSRAPGTAIRADPTSIAIH